MKFPQQHIAYKSIVFGIFSIASDVVSISILCSSKNVPNLLLKSIFENCFVR